MKRNVLDLVKVLALVVIALSQAVAHLKPFVMNGSPPAAAAKAKR